jgi:hypothetical protein
MRNQGSSVHLARITPLFVFVMTLAVVGCGSGEEGLSARSKQILATQGGAVILGGDDLTDHGSFSGGAPQGGWVYIQKAQESLKAQVNRPHDGTVAVLGSSDSTATRGDAGGAYHYTTPLAGMRPEFYDGVIALEGFFDALRAGTKRPAILVTAGTGAANDLDVHEGAVLSKNATTMADFVNSGGGLLSHGSGPVAYGWLSTLIPGIRESDGCNSSTLSLTPEGQAAFPELTNAHIRAGPCHSNFSGDLGGLQVLARDGSGRNIIIGGISIQLPSRITLAPQSATYVLGSANSHTVTATIRDGHLNPVEGTTVTFVIQSGPNAGTKGSAVTNASGQASFTYTPNGAEGTDLIMASFVDATGTTQTSTAVEAIWNLPPNRPPDCSTAAPSVDLIWPPNHQMVDISIQGVTDADNDPLTITITSIHQDEPVNGIADGNTRVDGAGVGTSTASVRAERSGSKNNFGNGRVYFIGFSVDDGKGGTCTGVVNVGVPHDQGGQPLPVNDGPLFDSTKS